MACGDDRPDLSNAAAIALELIHCASLVHDDLPCFDDADMRRGKATVHKAYSQPLAVLTGDSLIVLAFDVLAEAAGQDPRRALDLIRVLSRRTGMPDGICAGQGWESESKVNLSAYHRAKTGALFIAATQMGAIAAGQDAGPWEELGARIGEAFQVADDLRDALYDADALGKPAGQDAAHHRPNAVAELGVQGAIRRLKDILGAGRPSLCAGRAPGLTWRTFPITQPGGRPSALGSRGWPHPGGFRPLRRVFPDCAPSRGPRGPQFLTWCKGLCAPKRWSLWLSCASCTS
jgi:geranylgeranyl diphosphate synthase type II